MKMLEEALHTAVRRFGARALAANAAQFTRSPEDIWCEAREMRDTLEADAAQRTRTAPADGVQRFPAGTLAASAVGPVGATRSCRGTGPPIAQILHVGARMSGVAPHGHPDLTRTLSPNDSY